MSTTTTSLRTGEKVKAQNGRIFTVGGFIGNNVWLSEIGRSITYAPSSFTPVQKAGTTNAKVPNARPTLRTRVAAQTTKHKLPTRDINGRFASRNSGKAVKPLTLKRGSLYNVKRKRGVVTARLHTNQPIEGHLVLSIHGKPFLARRENVTLADDASVKAYLRDAGVLK